MVANLKSQIEYYDSVLLEDSLTEDERLEA
jgi:hypothetical protein